MDFEAEDFYNSSGGEEAGSEEDDLDHYGSGGDGVAEAAEDDGGYEEPVFAAVKKHYKILKKEDIRQLQEKDISTVSSVLSVPRGLACTLLCRNNWNTNSVYVEWFADDDKTRQPVSISGQKRKSPKKVCNICYDEIRPKNRVSAACGHPFCSDCWKTFISTSINDGPGCLTLICPEPGCKSTVGLELIDSLASAGDRDKYYIYLYRSYVERSRNRKWCPAPGCDFAVEFDDNRNCQSYDVICDCSHVFCWKCAEENHRPVDCKTVAKWIEKNSSEAENTSWILAYTKPCPKCQKAIEKNYGCNHMTCRFDCKYEFCWICLGPWKDHRGTFYSCNKYKEEEKKDVGEDEKRRSNAKKHMEKYIHYYERWDSNDKSRKGARIELKRAKNKYLDSLVKLHRCSMAEVEFVAKAWEQIAECRRVLKWTYAYGYYLSLENSGKMNLFECLQGEAEAALERLHHCVETEMFKYLRSHQEDFMDFRLRLVKLTALTRNYFESLVRALENNLSEVDSCGAKVSES